MDYYCSLTIVYLPVNHYPTANAAFSLAPKALRTGWYFWYSLLSRNMVTVFVNRRSNNHCHSVSPLSAGGGLSLLPNFQKKRGLTESQFSKGGF